MPASSPLTSPSEAEGSGFAPPGLTLFAPVVTLASPGPDPAHRAVAELDRTLPFFRRILFRPELDSRLQAVVNKMPPRQSTLISAAALYDDPAIPWARLPDGLHQIAVSGCPVGENYLYSLAPDFITPADSFGFTGVFALHPVGGANTVAATSRAPQSVIAKLGGEVALDTFGAAAITDTGAFVLRETYGDLEAPWDHQQGEFNHHDRAALDRLKHATPKLYARLAHYFEVANVIDEFSSSEGPFVLVNIDGRTRIDALKPFPHLYAFYMRFAPRVLIDSTVMDDHGNRWVRMRFDHGRIRIIFAVRDGMLVPFNAQLRPIGNPLALDRLSEGHYQAITSITLDKLGMRFGLGNIVFTATYSRKGEAMSLDARMSAAPQLIAPPVVNQMVRLIAGDFLATLAKSNGGMTATLASRRDSDGLVRTGATMSGELRYSPALGILARIGDAMADAHNVEVRNDERRLGQELFDAFVQDYNVARPEILSLDAKR